MSGNWLSWLADSGLKATLILALAGLVVVLLRRASAASRRLAWSAACVAILCVPFLTHLAPHVVSPLAAFESAWFERPGALVAPPAAEVEAPELLWAEAASLELEGLLAEAERDLEETPEPTWWTAAVTRIDRAAAVVRGWDWPAILVTIWALGALLCVSWLALGTVRALRIAARALPLYGSGWSAQKVALCERLGLRPERLRLLVSNEIASPMTFGTLRPVVLLPQSAHGWCGERRRVVLLHEFVHVAQRDWLVQIVSQLARAVYWFHPLAWIACRRLGIERELACDELVIASGTAPSTYAQHLLGIALAMKNEGRALPQATLAMAHGSQLEGRLMSILSSDAPRRGAVHLLPVLTCTALLTGSLGLVRTWNPPQRAHSPQDEPEVVQEAHERAVLEELNAARAATSRATLRRELAELVHANANAAGQEPRDLPGRESEHRALLDSLHASLRNLQERLAPALEELHPSRAQLEELHAHLTPLMDLIHDLSLREDPRQVDRLRERVARDFTRERVREREQEWENLMRARGEWQRAAERAAADRVHEREARNEAEAARARRDAARSRFDALQGRLDPLRSRLDAARESGRVSEDRLERLEERMRVLEREMRELRQRFRARTFPEPETPGAFGAFDAFDAFNEASGAGELGGLFGQALHEGLHAGMEGARFGLQAAHEALEAANAASLRGLYGAPPRDAFDDHWPYAHSDVYRDWLERVESDPFREHVEPEWPELPEEAFEECEPEPEEPLEIYETILESLEPEEEPEPEEELDSIH